MVSATAIIIPLYIYPSPGAWDFLTSSLASYPDVQFQAIVNPSNGPGAPPTPNSDYIPAIASLNTYSNVQTLCYVDTAYTTRAISDVETDISTCAGWANYADADIHVDGIFFDDAQNVYNETTSAYMDEVATYARNALGAARDTIIFNPGEAVDAAWYDIADYIIAFENSAAAYSSAILAGIPQSLRAQSEFIIYGFANSETATVDAVVEGGIGGLYITTSDAYSVSSADWTEFVADVAAAE
jgi:hypothetical protein